jgi:hypothetical protein
LNHKVQTIELPETRMHRRQFIRLAGGGIVAAAGTAALGGCSFAEVPPAAVAAWQAPPGDLELRRWVLSFALLAPNPHNRQPWQADLGQEGVITLRLDTERLLPATDPFGRQLLMGAGAFLELLTIAAAERGHRAQCDLFPDGEPGDRLDGKPFARVRLVADAAVVRDPLFAQVLARRTDRRAYDVARPVPAADADRLRAAIGNLPVNFGLAGDDSRVASVRTIAREAWRIELTTPAPMMESMHLLRIGSGEIDQHRDGITITSPFLVVMARTGLFDRSQFPAPDSQATQGQIKDFDAITASTPAYLWLITEGNRRVQQVDAGRAYARVNLAATAAGLAMHPNEQALQEYPEVARPYQAIHALLGAPSPRFTVQMLARVGYLPAGSSAASPAPRRGLSAHVAA